MTPQYRFSALSLASVVVVAACSGDAQPIESTSQIDAYLSSLPHLELAEEQSATNIACDNCPEDGQYGDDHCSFEAYTETLHSSEFVAFQPNSATLWPGVVVQGRDAEQGVLTPLSAKLAPVTFSVSLENIAGSPVGYMSQPSLSAFREQRNAILSADLTGATPAAIDYTIREVHSESQVAAALGVGFSWPGAASLTANFGFGTSHTETTILASFTQAYYTIDVDVPSSPGDLFADDVTLAQLQAETSGDNPPVYVQSITYGRRVIFSVKASASAHELRAAVEASMASAVSAAVAVDESYEKVLSNAEIKAFVLGGSGADAAAVVNGVDGLVGFIHAGGDYSKDSPGAPIAYKLSYVDNASTEFAFTSEYTESDCYKNRIDVDVELLGFDHIGGGDNGTNIEVFGDVQVFLPISDDVSGGCNSDGAGQMIWSQPKGSYLTMKKHGTWTPSSPVTAVANGVPFGESKVLCLRAELWETDMNTSADDYYGEAILELVGTDWAGQHVLHAQGEGSNAMDVRLEVSVQ